MTLVSCERPVFVGMEQPLVLAVPDEGLQDGSGSAALPAGARQHPEFAEWALRIRPRLVAFCRRLLWNEHDAEEIAQDVLMLAWRELGRLRAPGKLSTWAYRCAANCCSNRLRRRKPGALEAGPEPVAPEVSPADAGAAHELTRRLRWAIQELPEILRVAVVLRDLEMLDYKEIAAILRVRQGTARLRVHRGREALRRILLRHWPDAFGPD